MAIGRLAMSALLVLALAASGAAGGAAGAQAKGGSGAADKAPAASQGANGEDGFDIKAKELDQIDKILESNEETISKARAEIQILQAKVTRLLLEKEPSLDQIKALVKDSLDWELQVRMAQIERQIAIRKVIGEERWARVVKAIREAPALRAKGLSAQAGAKEAALVRRLQDILNRLR
jgi:hypothetical protein